ncbi:MAG: SpoIIE family protein phosphatase [Acidobacteria bacterium]|nr:SpoIIE family protein phosphatase [Acidobacteriota bacterium]
MASLPQRPPTILIVDDDQLITASLKSLFALETDYDVIAHTSPATAVREAEARPVDLIISDFLMPQINGVELLKRIRALQPDAVRILLTGFADKENAIRAINEVGLYQYLEKPWDNDDLLLLVRNALREKSLRKQLTDKVHELDKLIERHTQLSDRHQSLEEELERAARVQRSLLPERLPEVEGFQAGALFRPCRQLGGDFYDAIRRNGAVYGLLADVSGHGTHSALSAMLLKAVFDEACQDAQEPAEILVGMNNRLHRFMPRDLYACAMVARIAPGEPIRLANAGVPHPFLIRADGRVEETAVSGMPLGMFADLDATAFDTRSVTLEAGDTLLLATDGLGEVRNADGVFFQDGPLRETLSQQTGKEPACVVESLFDRVARYRAHEHFPDDITLIALRRL